MPLPDNLTDAEIKALSSYTGMAYKKINEALRGITHPPDRREVDELTAALDSAVSKSQVPESVIVHRTTFPAFVDALGVSVTDPLSMQTLVGRVIAEPGFLSTALGAAAPYYRDIRLMIRVPAGYPALNVISVSTHTSERELLIRRNARMIIHAVYQRGQSWYVEAEIVPDGWEPGPDWTPDPYGDAWEAYP